MKYITIFLVFLSALPLHAGTTLAVNGVYATMPSDASEALFLSQPLITLIIDPLKLEKIPVTGSTEMVKISETENGLKVTALNSAGAVLFEEETPSERSEKEGVVSYRIERKWSAGDEWGSSRGTTITWLKKEQDGSLRVSMDMTGRRRTFIFPWGKPRAASSWLKYELQELK